MVSDPSNSLTSLTRPHPETQMMPARPSFSFRVAADQLPVMRYCAVLLTAAVLSGGCASTKPKKNPANWVTFQDYSCLTNGGVITIACRDNPWNAQWFAGQTHQIRSVPKLHQNYRHHHSRLCHRHRELRVLGLYRTDQHHDSGQRRRHRVLCFCGMH